MLSPMEGGELAGRLLVATPKIGDPNFDRTVILVLAHGEEGAFGVVLNRPSDREAAELVPAWGDRAAPPSLMFLGGPVAPNAVVALGLATDAAADGVDESEGRQWLFGRMVTIDLNRPPDEIGAGIVSVRLFAGSAGWSPGQLEGEIATGGWWVVDATDTDAVDPDPERLWVAVLRRQPGELAWFAGYPDDASVN